MKISQAPAAVMMVRPRAFGFNHQTAQTNAFQHENSTVDAATIQQQALAEFDKMVDLLRSNDIEVVVVEDSADPGKPDAVFPNNWISLHADGTAVLYPMMAENRRPERSNPVWKELHAHGYAITRTIDLTPYEAAGKFLEGTGSIVFDYVNKLAYAARSPRTHEEVLTDLCTQLGFKPVVFNAEDEQGKAIYHTNVMMCVGTKFAMVCLDAIKNEADQDAVLESLAATGHKVIAIGYGQAKLFAGNMLEVTSRSGETFVLLSQKAYHALLPGQLDALTQFADVIPIAIPTLEEYGGGSVRCMVAGIFMPGA